MYNHLEWDSKFLGYRVASINRYQTDMTEIRHDISQLKTEGYRLLYWFVEPENIEINQMAVDSGAVLVDKKVTLTFQHQPNQTYSLPDKIIEYPEKVANESLISLGLECGVYSRFKIDTSFTANVYNNLYTEWVHKSVNHQLADIIYVFEDNHHYEGIITLREVKNTGHIVLIGVDSNSRGKRVGQKLIDASKAYFAQSGISQIDVVTQKANDKACRFYERNGFRESDLVHVYHLWFPQ